MEQSKRCKRCGEVKVLDDFYDHPQCRLGVRPECKVCTIGAQQPYREAHRARQRRYSRQWHDDRGREDARKAQRERYATDDEYRERVKAAARATYQRGKQKALARLAVAAALRNGVLVRENCIFCGDPDTEAHHHSYAKADWLNVTYVCHRHHGLIHRIVDEPVG